MSDLPAPPGRLIDVGGYRLHIQIQGEGQPATVLDSGLSGNSLLWTNTLPAVAKHTQVCAFDRAGYAWSDPAPAEVRRTSAQVVAELRILLDKAGLPPPYILVGHSSGAINMLVYAYLHPEEVAGLVLVDPSHPEMFERVPQVPSGASMARGFNLLSNLGRVGLLRWIGPLLARQLLPQGPQILPPESWQALVAFVSRRQDYQTSAREAIVADESFARARGGPGSLGDLLLDVLTAEFWVTGKQTPMKRAVLPLREEQAALSSRGRHLIVSGCDHTNLPVVRPDAIAGSVRHFLEILQGE